MRRLFVRKSAAAIPQPVYTFRDRPPSCEDWLHFNVEIAVSWQKWPGAEDDTPLLSIAGELCVAVADAANRLSVLRCDAAYYEICAATRRFVGRHGRIEVLDVGIGVCVDEATRSAALSLEHDRQQRHRQVVDDAARIEADYRRQIDQLKREGELDALARRQIRARVEFLRTQILADPGSAQLYALVNSDGDTGRLGVPSVDVDRLAELAYEIKLWEPPQLWMRTAQILHEYIKSLTVNERSDLLKMFARAAKHHQRPEAVAALLGLAHELDGSTDDEGPGAEQR